MNKEIITIGIDIGGTNTALGVIDSNNNFLFEESFLTNAEEGFDNFILLLSEKIKKACSSFEHTHQLKGIGVAAPGANYITGTIQSSANLKWGNVKFVELLSQYFNLPIVLINDADAAALGERLSGSAGEMNNFIVITLGTGLGTGIITNGNLLHGENGFAGEFGHSIIEKDGRQCNCGKSGCLETYVSATGLKRTAFDFLGRYTDNSELRNMTYQSVTSKIISDLALNSDPIALKAFDFTGEVFGRALSNIVTCFDPKVIILSGGLVQSDGLLLKPTIQYFEKYLLHFYKGKVKILKSDLLNGHAAILGASTYIRNLVNNSTIQQNSSHQSHGGFYAKI